MVYPSISEVKEYLKEYKTVPVFYDFLSDTHTPVHIYNALSEGEENSFIFESVSNKEKWGRYSFIGINPRMEIKIQDKSAIVKTKEGVSETEIDNPVYFLTKIMNENKSPKLSNRPNLMGGLIGYFGYDTVRYIEKKLVNIPKDDIGMPDCHLFLYDEIIAFDHLSNKIVIILNIRSDGDIEEQYKAAKRRARQIADKILLYVAEKQEKKTYSEFKVNSNVSQKEFKEAVEKAKEHINNGDVFQVVLSHRFEIDNPPDSFAVYRMLRATNPSPYLYYFKTPEYHIAGASPEMLVKVTDGIVKTKPIAGTICRGENDEEDAKLEAMLNADPKERAEHTMLVDLGRNDIGKVSKFGSVEVTGFMQTERYSKVMHLVSDVKGELRDDKNALDALMAVLPAGTLSGAPKVRAMELIDELENRKRGLYGGTVGYLAFDGNIDTCIAIRTVLFKNNKAYVQAGAGIVADSKAEKEFIETENKALAMINAIREAGKL